MSELVEINNIKYISIKSATKQVSYSKDYLAKLAREKKILATQVGRQWFINMTSLQKFVDVMNLEQAIRKQNLSEQRKRELSVKNQLQDIAEDLNKKIFDTKKYSLVVSSLVLGVGFFLGSMISVYAPMADLYEFADSIKINTNINEDLLATATVGKDLAVATSRVSVEEKTVIINDDFVYPLFMDQQEVRAMNSEVGGILLWVEEGGRVDDGYVKRLFSDPVSVEFSSDNSGLIKYYDESGDEVTYPFLAVPGNSGEGGLGVTESKL